MFSSKIRDEVWKHAQTTKDRDSAEWRLDPCGALIRKSSYGKSNDEYGWVVDHIIPRTKFDLKGLTNNAADRVDNLRVMHYRNNVARSGNYPVYKSAVRWVGNKNQADERYFEISKKLQEDLRNKFGL